MRNVLVVTGSIRSGRAAENILTSVLKQLDNYSEFNVDVFDFKKNPLPFFNASTSPSSEGFQPEDINVKKWSKAVKHADVVIMLVAEYNHSYTPVLKNAIDWLYQEWKDKPIALISYGWAGGTRATRHLKEVLNSTIKASSYEEEANLYFTKDIDTSGKPINYSAANSIDKVLKQIMHSTSVLESTAA